MVFSGGGITVTCQLTLVTSIEARIPKTIGALVARIETGSRVAEERCRGSNEPARAKMLSESFPWHVRYNGILGTLPAITGVKLILLGTKFLITSTIFGIAVSCLFEGTAEGTGRVGARGEMREITSNSAVNIPAAPRQPFGCPAEGTLTGTLSTAAAETPVLTLV
jgi:hypothetical protein